MGAGNHANLLALHPNVLSNGQTQTQAAATAAQTKLRYGRLRVISCVALDIRVACGLVA